MVYWRFKRFAFRNFHGDESLRNLCFDMFCLKKHGIISRFFFLGDFRSSLIIDFLILTSMFCHFHIFSFDFLGFAWESYDVGLYWEMWSYPLPVNQQFSMEHFPCTDFRVKTSI